MKQKDLLRLFFDKGWWVLREGANHIILTGNAHGACSPS